MTPGQPPFSSEQARIRAGLLATPGARECPLPGCTVITQDGSRGAGQHRQVVHPLEQR